MRVARPTGGAVLRPLSLSKPDTLVVQRSDVRGTHDRYANSETGCPVRSFESYGTPLILTTNLREHFVRLDFSCAAGVGCPQRCARLTALCSQGTACIEKGGLL